MGGLSYRALERLGEGGQSSSFRRSRKGTLGGGKIAGLPDRGGGEHFVLIVPDSQLQRGEERGLAFNARCQRPENGGDRARSGLHRIPSGVEAESGDWAEKKMGLPVQEERGAWIEGCV